MASPALPQIKDLNKLIAHLLKKEEVYKSYSASLLNAAGENYGSLMLAVDILVRDVNTQVERKISTVAKLCPPNPWIRRMFVTDVTFLKEERFYAVILPELRRFQQEQHKRDTLDMFPSCLGARLNLQGTHIVDDDAVLLLENLKTKGFICCDRMTGFNLPEAELVLKDLAWFHALPLAYKLTHPEQFKLFEPYLQKINIGQEMFDECPHRFVEYLNTHLKLSGTEFDRFEKGMYKGFEFAKHFPAGNGKFATIVHRDFWVNNAMILYDNNTPIKSKLLDFQVLTVGSPISDLVFFLFTSIQQSVLEKHYEKLVQVYYESFVKCMRDVNCDTSYYTIDRFKEEIDIYGPLEAPHVLTMFKAIYADHQAVKELSDFNLEDMFSDYGITEAYKNKLVWTATYFLQRNWF